MSLNVFVAICVLACDFLIYVFFQWTFGEKLREFPRRRLLLRPAKKDSLDEIAALKPFIVSSRERHRQSEREVA
jgi:hypothetical protein